MDMPEQIWVTHEDSFWSSFRSFRASDLDHGPEYPCYIRADLFDRDSKMDYIENNNQNKIEELETAVRALQQDLNYAGSQISDLIKLYAQLDAKFEAHKSGHDRELGWTGY